MKIGTDKFTQLGSIIASLVFLRAIFQQYFPTHLQNIIQKHFQKLFTFLYPSVQITFNEFTGERLTRSQAYSTIETYLSHTSSHQATRLKADVSKNSQALTLSMDDNEEVIDEFEGVKVWWASGKTISKSQAAYFSPQKVGSDPEKRFYTLKFHKKDKSFIISTYLDYVLREGNAIEVKTRQRKLYTNNGSSWSNVPFEHPAKFETLAMDPEKKKEIVDDLMTFSKAKGFYARIGRAWKRGYLLYGPPGTGKSSMIGAMSNLLGYDIYDLELTAVKDNTELKKLLIATSSKSIIVIEDIDCSVDLTGQRRKKKEHDSKFVREEDSTNSKVTLSGLLNFIDGLWSAFGGERLVVFTTNYVEKLDPALIRRGRMDKHVELSYCGFEGFKILAKNYLGLESHDLFEQIGRLLEEVKMTPADVAENLMPRTNHGDAEKSLRNLVFALEETREQKG